MVSGAAALFADGRVILSPDLVKPVSSAAGCDYAIPQGDPGGPGRLVYGSKCGPEKGSMMRVSLCPGFF
ncbi:hypothetical protein ES705_13537 [subsurface metagenome]